MLCPVCEINKANHFTGAPLKNGDIICYSCIKKLGLSSLDFSYKKIFHNYTAENLKELIHNNTKLNYKNELSKISSKKEEQKGNFKKTEQAFLDHKSRVSGKMHADFIDKKVLFGKSLTTPPQVVTFEDITSYTPTVNGHSVSKHHRGTRGIVGAMIAGPVGAVVGASTGGKDFDVINDVNIIINLSDGSSKKIKYINTEFKADSIILKQAMKEYREGIAILDAIIAANNNLSKIDNKQTIDSQELIKLKKLLDDGVITQDDFDTKKKSILGL